MIMLKHKVKHVRCQIFIQIMYHIRRGDAAKIYEKIADVMGYEDKTEKKIKDLSQGYLEDFKTDELIYIFSVVVDGEQDLSIK